MLFCFFNISTKLVICGENLNTMINKPNQQNLEKNLFLQQKTRPNKFTNSHEQVNHNHCILALSLYVHKNPFQIQGRV